MSPSSPILGSLIVTSDIVVKHKSQSCVATGAGFRLTRDVVTLTGSEGRRLFALSVGIFFIGGFLSSLVSLLVPAMKMLFGLDYLQALVTQTAFHSSYLALAVPIAGAIMRIGYMRSVAIGLGTMAGASALLFVAIGARSYPLVLCALLALSAGLTFLQIAGNTMIAVTGSEHQGIKCLNLLQSFNSLGTVTGPLLGASYLLSQNAEVPPWKSAALPAALTGTLVILCAAYAANRNLLRETPTQREQKVRALLFPWRELVSNRRLVLGIGAIFSYVGAEVTIGALLPSFLMNSVRPVISPMEAGQFTALYWGGAMLGRAVSALTLRWLRPARMLLFAAAGAILLTLTALLSGGPLGAGALLAVGLFNSTIYPTVFGLAVPRDKALATPGAMLLCMAVVGGAIIPLVTGSIADHVGLQFSLGVPLACYVLIAAFAHATRKDQVFDD